MIMSAYLESYCVNYYNYQYMTELKDFSKPVDTVTMGRIQGGEVLD
jgi:hypothetical protein